MLAKMVLLSLVSGLMAANVSPPPPPTSGLRLVKISEDDAGTWMTEADKFALVRKHVHFVDITETLELEKMRTEKAGRPAKRETTFPSGPSHSSEAAPIISAIKIENLKSICKEMIVQYSRHYLSEYSEAASAWMLKAARAAASANPRIEIREHIHTWKQNSIIVKVPGRRDDTVIVSAHFDSINMKGVSERAPGADDNASSVAVLLESLRVIAESGFAPQNTLEFHFYAAEEGGLMGSRDVMQEYARNRAPVRALVNQDMTGHSPNGVIAVFTDFVDAGLTRFVQTLIPVYTSLPVITDTYDYGCSDHASAYDAGFPAAFVSEDLKEFFSPYIHTSRDNYFTLDFPHMLEHAKFTVGFLIEGAYF